jgi:type III restriction enzyme
LVSFGRASANGIYLMPRDKDDDGRDIDEQIAHAIALGR